MACACSCACHWLAPPHLVCVARWDLHAVLAWHDLLTPLACVHPWLHAVPRLLSRALGCALGQDIARGAEARLLGSRRGTKPSYLNPTQGWRSRLTTASLSPVGSRTLLKDSKSTASIDGAVARDKTDGAGSVVGGSSVGGGGGGGGSGHGPGLGLGLGHGHGPSAFSSRWNGNPSRSRRGSAVAAGEGGPQSQSASRRAQYS